MMELASHPVICLIGFFLAMSFLYVVEGVLSAYVNRNRPQCDCMCHDEEDEDLEEDDQD